MTLTPFDFPPPADDPGPRYVRPIPANDLRALFNTHRPVVDDRPDLNDALAQSWRDRPAKSEARYLLIGAVSALLLLAVLAWVLP